MIVLDSSILVGIIKLEEGSERLVHLLSAEECTMGAPTLVETRMWYARNRPGRTSHWLEQFIDGRGISVVPFTRQMADIASQAFLTFGKGSGHPAKLNFGDCMTYAVSAILRAPLLYKGQDFGRTDVLAHPASIRA
jgi:ribonuclease VapC